MKINYLNLNFIDLKNNISTISILSFDSFFIIVHQGLEEAHSQIV